MALTEALTKAAADFECAPVEGILSHRLCRNLYDNEKTVVLNPSDAQKYEAKVQCVSFVILGVLRREHKSCEFELHEVYAIDVIVSTGDGKVRAREREREREGGGGREGEGEKIYTLL